VTTELGTQTKANLYPRRRRGPMFAAATKATLQMTTVALIPGAGTIPKHARDRFSPTTTLREKSVPVAKHLSYAKSRSRSERPRRIDGSSPIYPRELPQPPSSPRSALAALSVAPRSLFRTLARFAESAGGILLTLASWMFMQIVDGCFAYAVAMHGIPEAAVRAEREADGGGATQPEPDRPAIDLARRLSAGPDRELLRFPGGAAP
jgi:hypothetical protein